MRKKMKYIVDNRYYNDGTVLVKIHEVPNDFKFDYFIIGKDCDIWLDDFSTYEEAKQYADECEKNALTIKRFVENY